MLYDVLVIGGSYAGLSATLQLARARRSVVVVDAGLRRNRFAASSHGFLTQDGAAPGEIAAVARAQVSAYPTVQWVDGRIERLSGRIDAFEARTADGQVLQAKRVIIASGVTDVLPGLPGLAERWGRQVFHCPYCHGYELNQGRIGVLALSDMAMHQALLLPDWGPTTLFLNDRFVPDAEQSQALAARGVAVVPGAVERLEEGDALRLRLQDGRVEALDGLFTAAPTQPGPLAASLGCELAAGPMGDFVKTDEMQATSVAGVFACGDVARAAGSVALAVGSGAMAGAATHRSLLFP